MRDWDGHVRSSGQILSNATHSLRALLEHVVDLVVPQLCFACGQACTGASLCAACRAELPTRTERCPVCAIPTPQGQTCGACLQDPPAFDASHAAFDYVFPIDRMVQALKYGHQLSVVPFLAAALIDNAPDERPDILLPMPLHVHRLAARGFNQAVELARPLARHWQMGMALALVGRVHDVAPQAALTSAERRRNMRGVFSVGERLDEASVVVVDDVMTTGTSLRALAEALKAHGARRVVNLVVARTPEPC